jgi:hypothetical protein
METWDTIRARRNVRQYIDQPIARADLERILEDAVVVMRRSGVRFPQAAPKLFALAACARSSTRLIGVPSVVFPS